MESMKPGCRHSCVQEVQAAQGKACKLFATGLSCQKFDSPEREDAAMCSPLRPCGTLTVASRGTVVVASSVQIDCKKSAICPNRESHLGKFSCYVALHRGEKCVALHREEKCVALHREEKCVALHREEK